MPTSEYKEEQICPFTPFITGTQRSYTCIKDTPFKVDGKTIRGCKLWDKETKDCGLKR